MRKTTWVYKALEENSFDKKLVIKLYDVYVAENDSNATFASYKRFVNQIYEKYSGGFNFQDYNEDYIINLESSKQKSQDINNVLRKSNREGYRLHNTLEEIFSTYVDILTKVDLTKFNIKSHSVINNKKIGIFQLSDLHANEQIFPEESNNNAYDFEVMSRRLKKFTIESISAFKFKKITDVHIFMTGDFINSSRRLGEKLAQTTSLVRASLLTTFLLQQIIIELSKYFNLTISAVSGNESRIAELWDATNLSLSENYDYLIYNNLRMIFSKSPIKFNESKDFSKCVVPMNNGFNALVMHGNQFRTPNAEKEIGKFLQAYNYNGIKINGVFYGHYHSASLGDFVSRSSSLCGANAFSNNDLGYMSRASQNIYFVNEDGGYDAMKIDLQNTDSIKGYDIIEELERYNIKPVNSNSRVTIENLV